MGKHLVEELLLAGHDVTVATRGISPDGFGNQVTRLKLDRTSAESLKEHIPKMEYDVVFDDLAYCSKDVKCLLDLVRCRKYIHISSMSVYDSLHNDIKEIEFDPEQKKLVYCSRQDFPYDEVKRQAECAIVQDYPHIPSIRVRFPFVIGPDDYTQRLSFYVEHILDQKPMYVDNPKAQMAFVRSDEAGKFLAYLAQTDFQGAINGASEQTVSVEQIAEYVKTKTGKEMLLSVEGEKAPYNGAEDYSLNIDKAKSLGFSFTPLRDWVYDLIDLLILQAGEKS